MKKILLNLQRFGEGAGDGAGESGAAVTGEAAESPAAGDTKRGRKANPLANVKYGKVENTAKEPQPEAEEGEDDAPKEEKPVDKHKLFEEMIKGEYKEEYDARTQRIINKRFGEMKQLEERQKSIDPILAMISQKYGVDATDINALSKAIEEDDSFYEDEALARGLSVDQLKQMRRMERENEQLKRAQKEAEKKAYADNAYRQWMQESEALKAKYPGFDFEQECANKDFTSLLANGIDVETAYEVIHKDEIIGGAMQYAAQQVRQKTVQQIQAKGSRPTENGVASQAAVVTKSDPSKLTKQDRAEIMRRVARGEKISF